MSKSKLAPRLSLSFTYTVGDVVRYRIGNQEFINEIAQIVISRIHNEPIEVDYSLNGGDHFIKEEDIIERFVTTRKRVKQ